jgi:hypothetical protein
MRFIEERTPLELLARERDSTGTVRCIRNHEAKVAELGAFAGGRHHGLEEFRKLTCN